MLYRARVRGVANGFGEYRAVLRVRYKTAAAVAAQVTVRALTPGGRAVTSALVTITP